MIVRGSWLDYLSFSAVLAADIIKRNNSNDKHNKNCF